MSAVYTMCMSSTFNGFALPRTQIIDSATAVVSARALDGTVASRVAIGFPDDVHDWMRSPAHFTKGALRICDHPVMEDWETEYMGHLAAVVTATGGDVLEVGYGLGLSAGAIQGSDAVNTHTIIECHPDVVRRCLDDWPEAVASQRLRLMVGMWQHVTGALAPGSYDAILFDTYPLRADELHSNHFEFFDEAHRLLRPGGVLTYYSDEEVDLSELHVSRLLEAGFRIDCIESYRVRVIPPDACEYWTAPTLVVPVVRK